MITKKVLGIILGSLLMNGNYCNGRSVTITVDGNETTYHSFKSISDVRNFAIDLKDACETDITIEGTSSNHKILDAVKAVFENTGLAKLKLDSEEKQKAFGAMVFWEIQKWLYGCSIDTAIHCLKAFDAIAPNAFEKARLLILSQCDSDGITPVPTADWNTIGSAILMLKEEKNGYSVAAKELLGRLKATGQYDALLGKWHDDTQGD